jgi:hypothetical protein
MKKISLRNIVILSFVLSLFAACGGGGGVSNTPSQPTTAVLTLSTAATSTIPASTTINSYNVTITLPAGVTVKTMPGSSETATGVVAASGQASSALIFGTYSAATGTFPGTVKVYIVKVDPITGAGFNPGEFCKVTGNIAPGVTISTSDFVPPTLDDASGIDATKSTVLLTGELSLTGTAIIY